MLPTTVSPPWAYTLHSPARPPRPGIARTTLRAVLATYGLAELAPTAELLAAEMLSNAHCHTRPLRPPSPRGHPAADARRRMGLQPADPARIVGAAAALGTPAPAEMAESGRGLHLVQACADAWGAYRLGDADPRAPRQAPLGRVRAGVIVSGVTYRDVA